jgi:hypothetical protein
MSNCPVDRYRHEVVYNRENGKFTLHRCVANDVFMIAELRLVNNSKSVALDDERVSFVSLNRSKLARSCVSARSKCQAQDVTGAVLEKARGAF